LGEDLAQETFLRATRAFLGWRGGSPAAWLLVIARNVLIDDARRGRRLVPIASATSIERAADHDELGQSVRDVLAELPKPQRRLLELAYLDGFSHAEIASMSESTPAAIRTAIWRARAAFRDAYETGLSDD
jgi:RNA polymerase sigma-70 factor (ECF subfamily)